jgi:hypothetical protein
MKAGADAEGSEMVECPLEDDDTMLVTVSLPAGKLCCVRLREESCAEAQIC